LHIAFFVQFSLAKSQSRPPRRIGRELPQLQLFILAAEVVFARRKKKKMNKAPRNSAGQAAKTPRRKGKPLWVFVRRKKKKKSLPPRQIYCF
jgi:hypothetical protein